MRHLIADGDNVFLVPVVGFEIGIDRCWIVQGCKKPWILSFLSTNGLALKRDDPSAGCLFIKLAGVSVTRVEVVLRAGHVPLCFTGCSGRCTARLSARAGFRLLATTSAATSRIGRYNPTTILHATINVAGALHLQFQFEIRRLTTLPDQINRSRRFFAGGFDNDCTVLYLPILIA